MARERVGRVACGALLVALTGCATTSSSAPPPSGAASSLPDFELSAVTGQNVRLSEHLGRDVVLLAFWATWCDPCKAELPHLDRLYRTHKSDGFAVLAISMDDPATIMQVAPYAHEAGFDFPVLLDPNGLATNLYNTHRSAPYTVIISREGKIVSESTGFEVAAVGALEEQIRQLLAAKP